MIRYNTSSSKTIDSNYHKVFLINMMTDMSDKIKKAKAVVAGKLRLEYIILLGLCR